MLQCFKVSFERSGLKEIQENQNFCLSPKNLKSIRNRIWAEFFFCEVGSKMARLFFPSLNTDASFMVEKFLKPPSRKNSKFFFGVEYDVGA